MTGYLLPIIGETSLAFSLPDGLMMRFAGAVLEKFLHWTCLLVAPKRRSPWEYILTTGTARLDEAM